MEMEIPAASVQSVNFLLDRLGRKKRCKQRRRERKIYHHPIKYSTQSMHFSSEFDVVTCPSLNRSLSSEMAFSDIALWPKVGRRRNSEKCVLATVQQQSETLYSALLVQKHAHMLSHNKREPGIHPPLRSAAPQLIYKRRTRKTDRICVGLTERILKVRYDEQLGVFE